MLHSPISQWVLTIHIMLEGSTLYTQSVRKSDRFRTVETKQGDLNKFSDQSHTQSIMYQGVLSLKYIHGIPE